MNAGNRRTFIKVAAMTAASLATQAVASERQSSRIYHQVFFWLRRPDEAGDRERLIAGLTTLATIPQVRELRVGVPASTERRDVVDASFDVSELMIFDSLTDQKAYQDHPVHRAFVADCGPLWRKVVVYDTVPA
jgi:hypothetical protein